jgi:para-aminobenzoate synthetase component I
LHLSLPLNHRTGSQIFDRLFRSDPIATLLESPVTNNDRNILTRYSICAGIPRKINGQPQLYLRGLLANTDPEQISDLPAHLPFTGGWLGWLGYELAWEIEALPARKPDSLPFPIAYWYAPHTFAILDHWEQLLYLAAPTAAELTELSAKLAREDGRDRQVTTMLYKPKNIFKLAIFSKLIYHCGLALTPISIPGRSIKISNASTLRHLPAIGKHRGER